ncbi:MAG: MFS transporter [Geodermatophilaceae bacterium]|nr:MFS transporter [Geodermatophilaceae bacterium]MDQ3463251.1 MFS transporter [Actinomycetota bacterium]
MFASLQVRNYRLFASGSLVSNTGTWMQRVAQDWLVLELSNGSGVALGLVTALQFGPILVFGMYGGMLADRYDKRTLLFATQASMGLLALVLGVLDLVNVVALWHVYVLATGLGIATALDTPIRQAFVSELVGPERLTNAVGLNSSTFNAARLVGPAVAGLLIAAFSTAPVFFINAASFGVTLFALTRMRPAELFGTTRVARGKGQLREALRYVRARPDLMLPMLLVFIVGTFGLNFQLTTALMAREVFKLDAAAFGLLGSCVAVGSLTGALLSARRRERPRLRLLIGAAMVFGVLEMIAGVMPTFASFAILLVPTGAAALTFIIAANSSVQLGTDATMRGRVMALYLLFFMGGTPIGAPIVGWLSENFGARSGIIIGGLCCVLAAAAIGARLAVQSGLRVEAHVTRRPHLQLRTPAVKL